MSSLAPASRRAALNPGDANTLRRRRWPGVSLDAAPGAGLAAAFAAVAFVTTGGSDLAPNTWVQIALVTVGGVTAAGVVAVGGSGRAWGGLTLLLFGALAALTFASIAWSVQPDNSWDEANRTLSYLAAFGTALALARLAPGRWPAVVGAIAAAATVICAYALLTKVFPASLDASDPIARLKAPFGYWNTTGLLAAMGLPACIWAASRPAAGRILRTLSVPAIAILMVALVLSYSRGALIAAIVACGCWFALVSVRLRAILVLGVGAAGGGAVTLWALGHQALTQDNASLAARTSAGHTFGIVLLVALAMLTVAGYATAVVLDRVSLPGQTRRRIGTALVVAVALVPLGGLVGVATSSRGLPGEVSHIWTTLTSANTVVTETPGRLVQLSNSRPRYWREGLKVGQHALLKGTGAGGFLTARTRYSSDQLVAGHAHSYVIETFADFGLIGTLLSLALLMAWAAATGRTLGWNWRRHPRSEPPVRGTTAERDGLVTMLAVVLIFGIHSAIDWTWFFPGVAIPALVCAGWLAGRGPLSQTIGRVRAPKRISTAPATASAVIAVAAITVAAAWVIWQPLRSADAGASAVVALMRGDASTALSDARTAVSADPVSANALWQLSAIEDAVGNRAAARAELVRATSRQPSNAETWLLLGEFDLRYHQPRRAVAELGEAARLDLSAPQPLWDLSATYTALHDPAAARAQLVAATVRQPRSPDPFERLAAFDLRSHAAQAALAELQVAQALGGSPQTPAFIAQAQAQLNARHAQAVSAAKRAAHPRRGR